MLPSHRGKSDSMRFSCRSNELPPANFHTFHLIFQSTNLQSILSSVSNPSSCSGQLLHLVRKENIGEIRHEINILLVNGRAEALPKTTTTLTNKINSKLASANIIAGLCRNGPAALATMSPEASDETKSVVQCASGAVQLKESADTAIGLAATKKNIVGASDLF
jgi:hypothetical protein